VGLAVELFSTLARSLRAETLVGEEAPDLMTVEYFEPQPDQRFDPATIATSCIEHGARAVLLDDGAIPREFFDLSTRVAGELLHRLGLYGIRLAAVVPDPAKHSNAFQDFVREANRGGSYRFFATRSEAVAWLEG